MMSEQESYGVGEQLKMRREELGHTLGDVASQTRIRKVYLAHLEADEFSALPGEAYVTGFIRAYARFLNLPADPLMRALHAQAGTIAHESGETSPSLMQASAILPAAKSRGDRKMFLVGLVVVLILGGALYFLLDVVTLS